MAGGEGKGRREERTGACLWRQRRGTCFVFLLEDEPERGVDMERIEKQCWAVIVAGRQRGLVWRGV